MIHNLSDLNGTNGFRLVGAAGDLSGISVSSAGDINGDGLADVLIGAHGAPAGSFSGASYVVFGRNTAQNPFPASLNLSDLDGTNGFRLNGVAAEDGSGFAVSSAGDVNGDGLADLFIGAPGADPNGSFSGASYVVFGRNSAQTGSFPASLNLSDLDGTNGFRLNGVTALDLSGRAVSSAEDVNGDGIADLLIGAYGANPNASNSGASYVVFGRNTAQTGPSPASLDLSDLDGTNGFRLEGVAAGDGSGRAVSSAGDVNGDGLADLLIGAPGADPNGTDSGASYVVFGGPPPPPPLPPPPPPPVEAALTNPGVAIPCTGSACNVRISCNLAESSGTPCVNRIRLFVRAAAARFSGDGPAKAQRRIRFAFGVANVPPAQTAKVKLTLTKKSKDIAKRKRGKKLTGVLEIRNAPGTAFSNTPIKIRLR